MSVSRAAERLHVTQPGSRCNCAKLGKRWVPLPNRPVRGIALTGAGADCASTRYGWPSSSPSSTRDGERRGAYRGASISRRDHRKYFVPMLLMRFARNFRRSRSDCEWHTRSHPAAARQGTKLDLIMMGRVPDEIECIAAPFAPILSVSSALPDSLLTPSQFDLRYAQDQEFVVRETGSARGWRWNACFRSTHQAADHHEIPATKPSNKR